MQIRFFTVAVHGGQAAGEALNQFLASNRVLSMALDRVLPLFRRNLLTGGVLGAAVAAKAKARRPVFLRNTFQ